MGGVRWLRRAKNVKLPPENSHREKEGGREDCLTWNDIS